MTGRRLYDKFCDVVCAQSGWNMGLTQLPDRPLAWPALNWLERKVWNDMARRLSPKKRVVA